ncbi:two-component system sensor histidine kinase NtrB [Nitratidesulfovibrio sp. SRB-5]|uniref:two-component system sensor histidine kinase NtrB n=1 Tax=Nitratidesulfovibrio sp. SRB-5 TaxID=2872636 RepID=UPI001025BF64|nr:ATP-binding protein [Nitratidesulfovibrio sp. SRB-5]MBZ2172142.1 PAS domain-containing protein [Nitratidesulfovibrio sp. SRB-5]RXF76415.1 PAS domain S-box protein [Desulfovibrio sp. DS-1]
MTTQPPSGPSVPPATTPESGDASPRRSAGCPACTPVHAPGRNPAHDPAHDPGHAGQALTDASAAPRRPFPVALAGVGRALRPVAGLLQRPDFLLGFPWVHLTGMLLTPQDHDDLAQHACQPLSAPGGPPPPDPAALEARAGLPPAPPAPGGVPRFAAAADLFAAQPGLRMVIDLTDDGRHMAELRVAAPAGVSLLDAGGALWVWEMLASEKLCSTCNLHLREARDLFATLIDQVDEDILLLDTEGRIVDLNRNILQRKGGTKDDWIGTCCWQLDGASFCCPPEHGGCTFRETVSTGHKAERIHTRVNDDGRVQYFRVYTYPVTDDAGRLTRVIEMRRDITNRTNMEIRLQQAEKMAAIGELSTYVAHEIRNPLFAIGGFANSLLRSPSLDEAARGKVQVILEESRRLDTILKSILNFARPTSPRTGEVDLNLLARQTMELMSLGFDQRRITVDMQLAPDIPKAHGDGEMLKQCLINLVKNAQEAMPEGGRLTVRTGMNQQHVHIAVADTGVGIPPELHDKIFSPFFSTKEKGAGIGLAMSRKIIEEMGGRVDLQSQVGKGTTITLHLLPLLAVPRTTEPARDDPAGDGMKG